MQKCLRFPSNARVLDREAARQRFLVPSVTLSSFDYTKWQLWDKWEPRFRVLVSVFASAVVFDQFGHAGGAGPSMPPWFGHALLARFHTKEACDRSLKRGCDTEKVHGHGLLTGMARKPAAAPPRLLRHPGARYSVNVGSHRWAFAPCVCVCVCVCVCPRVFFVCACSCLCGHAHVHVPDIRTGNGREKRTTIRNQIQRRN